MFCITRIFFTEYIHPVTVVRHLRAEGIVCLPVPFTALPVYCAACLLRCHQATNTSFKIKYPRGTFKSLIVAASLVN